METRLLSIRPMTVAEFDMVLDWAALEGWNPGRFDAQAFRATDPEGLLIGLLAEQPVAAISAIKYDDSFGFVGFYIVKPAYRGQGYGWQIWQAAMARLAKHKVGLDGVLAQQDNYRRSGFQLAHRNIRYQGTGACLAIDSVLPLGTRLLPLAAVPLPALASYDRSFFPADRSTFLRYWISQPQSMALGLLRDDSLLGYGVLRSCRVGYKIGPLFADTTPVAAALLSALCGGIDPAATIFLDAPQCNPAAVALAESRGMRKVFETARMYTAAAPDLAMQRNYGITSFELG